MTLELKEAEFFTLLLINSVKSVNEGKEFFIEGLYILNSLLISLNYLFSAIFI